MRKLNLKNYTVTRKVQNPADPMGEPIEAVYPYHVKDTILNLMFAPGLRLSGAELVKQNVLAIKLETCKDDEILLEDGEYDRVKQAIDAFAGFARHDVKLVERINNAEVVEVEPKK